MAFNKTNEIDEEQVVSFLENTLKRVENDSDPESLNRLKKIFKQTVPFGRRMYVAAYLTRNAVSHSKFGRQGRDDRFGSRPERGFDRQDRGFGREDRGFDRRHGRDFSGDRGAAPQDKERGFDRDRSFQRQDHGFNREERGFDHSADRPAPVRVQIDPSQATTIFISIGRNRRVFPRDLVGLLVSVAGLERERIGEIRVLANYSFIQLFTEDCEKAISALNGYDYRGRTLSVSYSKQRGDGDAEGSFAPEQAERPAASGTASGAPADTGAAENIPAGVSNEGHGIAPEASESARIAAEQTAFAAQQVSSSSSGSSQAAPYSETTDDGQVKSHFGSGEAY